MDRVADRLAASRLELLDLTLRNPLLNHRSSAARGLEIIDEDPRLLFTALVEEEKTLRFHATRKPAPHPGGTPPPEGFDALQVDSLETGTGKENPAGSLATPYDPETLDERLQATHYHASASLSEQGANILFLALGFLRWRDAASPDEERHAPLVLVPARLERSSVRAHWGLRAAEEDPGVNLSLLEKLRETGAAHAHPGEIETAADLERAFAAFDPVVEGRAGWAVDRTRAVLGFFSFGKFLMYRDLDPAAWPEDRKPAAHGVLASLLAEGFRDRGPAVPAGVSLDEARTPGKVVEILDADSSQAEALADVAAGRHLVVQGPPGTGKSQTISNLVAEAVAGGKRVLFVAEKMAALEVVHRRLRNAGLGPLCLELHSNKASKKEILAELKKTLEAGRPLPPADTALVDQLPALRAALNAYVKALSEPVGPTGLSPARAVGLLERLAAAPVLSEPAMASWDAARMEAVRVAAAALAAKIGEIGIPDRHPFAGCAIAQVLPGDAERVLAAARELAASTLDVVLAAKSLDSALRHPAPFDEALRLAELLVEAPPLDGLAPVGPAWDRPEALDRALEAHGARRDLEKAAAGRLLPAAWTQNLQPAREDLAAYGGTWFSRFFSPRYRAAKRRILGVCAAPLPQTPEDLLARADTAVEARRLDAELAKAAEDARPLTGARSDWDGIAAARTWIARFRALGREGVPLPPDVGALKPALEAARRAKARWDAAAGAATAILQPGPLAPTEATAARAEGWVAGIATLPAWAGYAAQAKLLQDLGAGSLLAAAAAGTIPSGSLVPALERAWAASVADRAFRDRPELARFDVSAHEQTVERFRRADAAVFGAHRAAVAERHWRSMPGKAAWGQVGLLRRECQKKSRHLPLRTLLREAGAAVQAAKPVFLMSPLSVAAYLPPDGPRFDLVVFDEASQVRPVDAFGAILRGRQLVVVGDEQQMPPTSFFDSAGGEDPDEEAPESVTEGVQSILGLCSAQGMPSRMLSWHYRSRHESLIAVSNREFYGGGLVVFPSPRRRAQGEGLSLRLLKDTVYERGTTRTNPKEADAVAAEVLEHARKRPKLSLGVVAFSMSQREAIGKRVEALCRTHADLDAWVNAASEEPFFVKNLENVQGDERDVMLISAGYGRDAEGKVGMNFGPLNQSGGERRLNVLITRARIQCVAFSNLAAEDIDLGRAPGQGVRAFRAFLDFAADRRFEEGTTRHDTGDPGDFERAVRAELAKAGHGVESDLGGGGFRLDLAVADPSRPDACLLGIETDGVRYRDARWARDRDRLRDSALRGLGWSLHRVWTADWHRSRSESLRRCLEAVERAKSGTAAASAPAPLGGLKRSSEEPPGWAPPAPYVPVKPALRTGSGDLADLDLAPALIQVVEGEGPVHEFELQRRLLESGDARSTPRRQEAIMGAMTRAEAAGRVRRRGAFLWPAKDPVVAPRDRSELSDASRSLDLVSDEECRAALERARAESCGCDADEAAVQAVRLLGVKRNDDGLERLRRLFGPSDPPAPGRRAGSPSGREAPPA